jgi:hypothetical protein
LTLSAYRPGREPTAVTRPLLRSIRLASALSAALVVATAPQVLACKYSDKTPPCSTPSSPESEASLMFAASSPSTSIPDPGPDGLMRSQPLPSGIENTVRPMARRSAQKSTPRATTTNATRVNHAPASHAEPRSTAPADAKRTPAPEPAATRWTAAAPRASEGARGTIVSRPHRMPGPEIF